MPCACRDLDGCGEGSTPTALPAGHASSFFLSSMRQQEEAQGPVPTTICALCWEIPISLRCPFGDVTMMSDLGLTQPCTSCADNYMHSSLACTVCTTIIGLKHLFAMLLFVGAFFENFRALLRLQFLCKCAEEWTKSVLLTMPWIYVQCSENLNRSLAWD